MSRTLNLMLATSLLMAAGSAVSTEPAMNKSRVSPELTGNPFLVASALPFRMPPFDKIKDAHFAPAFAEGMRQQLAEVDAIAGNAAAPTFDNTVVALERSGRVLDRVSKVFFNLTAANTNDRLEALELDLAPKLSAHNDAIMLNGKLFMRIKVLHAKRDKLGLDAESMRLLDRYYTDFMRDGGQLSDLDKTRLKAMNAELATLATAFSQNVLKDINASAVIVDSRADLAGLSESAIAAAAQAAEARGLHGKYVLALMNTTGQPPEVDLANRALRERLQQASLARGSHGGDFDNQVVVLRLARLRAERARLLGYPNHAAYVLEDETAHTTSAVNKLLAELAPPAVANARKEAAAMQALVDADNGGFELASYDWAYYAEKLRRQRYDFDEAQLRPYFELNSVLQNGVFYAANRLYGITFKERKDLPVYQSDVRVFEVADPDGKPLALFMTDFLRTRQQARRGLDECLCRAVRLVRHAPGGGEPSQHSEAAAR